MVLGVCRRILRDAHDAEDAFQAVFLILVRKAATIRPRAQVGNWLYGVAWRTAQRAQAMNLLRRRKEREAKDSAPTAAVNEADTSELLRYLDAELARLPKKYRVPIVLCELEGKSRKEAAQLLGLAEGTLSWRLAWARKLLARKLTRRGVALSTSALASTFASNASGAVSPRLVNATAKAALQVAAGRIVLAEAIPAPIITLTEGVLRAMFLSKLKVTWAITMAIAIGAGASMFGYRAWAGQPGSADQPQEARAAADDLESLRLEIEALRKSLQATRERVKVLEDASKESTTLKARQEYMKELDDLAKKARNEGTRRGTGSEVFLKSDDAAVRKSDPRQDTFVEGKVVDSGLMLQGIISITETSYLVAKKKIELGTLIKDPEAFFRLKVVRRGDEPKKAIKTFAEVMNRRVNKPVGEEHHLTSDDLFPLEGIMIKTGMRAFGIKCSAEAGVEEFVLPQSHVDILASVKGSDGKDRIKRVYQNVLVIAVDTMDK